MADPVDDEYNDGHRALLQSMLAKGSFTFEDMQPVMARIQSLQQRKDISPSSVTSEVFSSQISILNDAISRFDMEIRSTPHQTSRTRIYALVNSSSDAMTQLATHFSADEISFIKRVLDGMFETFNTPREEVMALTSMQALKLARAKPDANAGETQGGTETQGSAGAGITQANAEDVLGSLVAQGWFEKSSRGFYSLSARALMELGAWLVETYSVDEDEGWQAIKTCYACKEIVTVGVRCAKRTCNCRFHAPCAGTYFRNRTEVKCPVCKEEWTGDRYVGEKAATTTPKSKKTNGTGAKRRSSGVTRVVVEDDDEEESDEDDVRPGPSSRGRVTNGTAGNGKGVNGNGTTAIGVGKDEETDDENYP